MPDENVTPPVLPVSGNQNTAVPKGDSITPQFVPVDDFRKLESTTNYLAAELRKLRDNKPNQIQTETPPTPEKPSGKGLSEVEQLKAELRAKDQKALQTKRDAAIKSAIEKKGLHPVDAEMFYDHVIQRYDKKIVATDEKIEAEWTDPNIQYAETKNISIDEFIGNVLKTKGDRFKTAPTVPNGNQYGNNGQLKQSLSNGGAHQLSGKTYKEIMEISRTNPGLFQDFVINHKEQWAAIKAFPK